METYLTVDIGNTSVSVVVMKGLRSRYTKTVEVNQPVRHFTADLSKVLADIRRARYAVDGAVVCSVVPAKTALICRLIKTQLKTGVRVIGRDLAVPLVNKYRDPEQVGRDRLVGAFATQQLYGQPAIVIDFGTAITFDVLSHQAEYRGGLIVPGMRLSLESLHSKTAMLPKIEDIRRPAQVVGRTTEHSILSGLVYGYGEMCRGLLKRISADLRGKPRVVVTGGYARLMVRFLQDFKPVVDQHLVHKGLVLCARPSSRQ